MKSRRDLLKATLVGASALALPASARRAAPRREGGAPRRFLFLHRGNGLFPRVLVPPSFDAELQQAERRKQAFEVDLDGHELPGWMSALEPHKEHLTLLQGLSGKMCTVGHHSFCSSMGVYKANQRLSSIKWATVDFELAKLFPSPVGHVEFACFPESGGNPRGNLAGIEMGFSARGPQQPNYAFGSPKVALRELFQSVTEDEGERVGYELERRILEFASASESARAAELRGHERGKVQSYADAIDAIRERNQRVEAMADVLRHHVPRLEGRLAADDLTTLERQSAHTEVLLGALISGLTNVVAFTVDELGHSYTGLPGLEGALVNMHDVGHGKSVNGMEAELIREHARRHHMSLVDRIVRRLQAEPEGEGTMFDNTVLFYFPDGGESHHATGEEFPFLVLAGRNARLDLGRRYIRLPRYGEAGHKTLGNWYTTLLNAYGNPIEHYGDPDVGLDIEQRGPIERFLR